MSNYQRNKNKRWGKLLAFIRKRYDGELNLERANLERANLVRANLAGANLAGANLADAYLVRANLAGANLEDANLWGANLARANLAGANLRDANLEDANLWGANLRDANLEDANLVGANLRGANLERATLWDANLWGANLWGAYLKDVTMNWQSHNLIAERLRQSAGENAWKRMIAGGIAMSTDWCYDKLLSNIPPEVPIDTMIWLRALLLSWRKDGDGFPTDEILAGLKASKQDGK